MKAAGEFPLPDEVLKAYLQEQHEAETEVSIDEEYNKLVPGLRWQLVSDSVAKALQLQLTEDDLRNVAEMACRNQFAQYGMQNVPEDMLKKYVGEMLQDRKVVDSLGRQAMEMKLFNGIRAKAKVDEKTVSVEEFNALFKAASEVPAEPAE